MPTHEVYLIRHGIAEDQGRGGADHLRALTPEGIDQLRAAAAGLARLNVQLDVIMTSPLVRARQTADVLAAHLGGNPPVVVSSTLATTGSPAEVTAALKTQTAHRRIALVGHEPGMGELVALYLGMREPSQSVVFKKGAVCRIDFAMKIGAGEGSLRWFVTPRMLSYIAQASG